MLSIISENSSFHQNKALAHYESRVRQPLDSSLRMESIGRRGVICWLSRQPHLILLASSIKQWGNRDLLTLVTSFNGAENKISINCLHYYHQYNQKCTESANNLFNAIESKNGGHLEHKKDEKSFDSCLLLRTRAQFIPLIT